MIRHDPEQYWDAKAAASAHDPLGAVCVGDPQRDLCIDRVQRRLLRLALARLDRSAMPARPALLDMGCGTGRFSQTLTQQGFSYHGIDIAGGMIDIARREHPHSRFDKFDGQNLPFPDASFDVAMSLAVVHHNTYARQDVLLDELVRVLAPGGTLLTFEGIAPRTTDETGVFFYRPVADWRSALEARGLELLWQRGARYFALEHIGSALASRAGFRRERVSPTLLKLGAIVDPYLIAARPNRLHDRWFAIWRKRAAVEA